MAPTTAHLVDPVRPPLPVRQWVLTVQGAMPTEKDFDRMLCADIDRFSLHAAVRCGADDRQVLEQLCRHITRPAVANQRVQTNAAGQVGLKLKTSWRDGTTHPGDVAAGVHAAPGSAGVQAAAAPHRFHGVLAPNAKLRPLVLPQGLPQRPEPAAQEAKPAESEANCAHLRPVQLGWAKLLQRALAAP